MKKELSLELEWGKLIFNTLKEEGLWNKQYTKSFFQGRNLLIIDFTVLKEGPEQVINIERVLLFDMTDDFEIPINKEKLQEEIQKLINNQENDRYMDAIKFEKALLLGDRKAEITKVLSNIKTIQEMHVLELNLGYMNVFVPIPNDLVQDVIKVVKDYYVKKAEDLTKEINKL
jgi:Txe/YoeB family toxin of Txe-Axe toxin-antitoxin module